MAILFIRFLVIVIILGIITAIIPYVIAFGLLILAIFLIYKLGETSVKHFSVLNQSFVIFREKRKSLRLTKQKCLGHLKISYKNCIFIPKDIEPESLRKSYRQNNFKIYGSKIDLINEKIENCSYPSNELSLMSQNSLLSSFGDRSNVEDIIKGINLLIKMIKIREEKILPIKNIYQRLADNCRRDSELMISSGIVADVEGFMRYRKELYRRLEHLKQIEKSDWHKTVNDIYQTIKVESNYFVINSFSDINKQIDELTTYVSDCEASRELYSNLSYKNISHV